MSRNLSIHRGVWPLALLLCCGYGALPALADTEDSESSGLREIAAIQAERGDVGGAKKTVWLIDDKWSQIWGLRDIAMIQAEHKDVAGAKKTIWLMGNKGAEAAALRDLAVIQAEQRDVAGRKNRLADGRQGGPGLGLTRHRRHPSGAGRRGGGQENRVAHAKAVTGNPISDRRLVGAAVALPIPRWPRWQYNCHPNIRLSHPITARTARATPARGTGGCRADNGGP